MTGDVHARLLGLDVYPALAADQERVVGELRGGVFLLLRLLAPDVLEGGRHASGICDVPAERAQHWVDELAAGVGFFVDAGQIGVVRFVCRELVDEPLDFDQGRIRHAMNLTSGLLLAVAIRLSIGTSMSDHRRWPGRLALHLPD